MPNEASLAPAPQFVDAEQQRNAATLGMWVFLATEVLFFGVLFTSYLVSRLLHYEGFVIGSHHTDMLLGSINSALLLTSSLCMSLAVREAALERRGAATMWMILTLSLGLLFLGIKGYEYLQDYHEGLVPMLKFDYTGPQMPEVELFFYLYFVMTGLHALHLFIGIGVLIALVLRNLFGRTRYSQILLGGLYWHFVDVVWIFLYPLMYLVGQS
jgi:cytochrome c oxidase subunit 3